MRYTDRIKNLTAVHPKLSRVWIKSQNPRAPLKSVWISDSVLRHEEHENCGSVCQPAPADLVEEHLLLAA